MDQTASPPEPPSATPAFGQRGTGPGEEIDIKWRGSPWSLTGLSFLNFLLSVITLGIYSFWGKTEVRKRIWSSVRLNDEPLHYTGTGKELFLGFLIVFCVFLLPVVLIPLAIELLVEGGKQIADIIRIIAVIAVFPLLGVAIYRARRYRLSRTNWRGIRGTLTGSPWRYAWTYIWTGILIIFTLGWIIPYRAHALYKRMTNEQQFGSEMFRYSGDVGDVYARFAAVYFGGIALTALVAGGAYWFLGIEIPTTPTAVENMSAETQTKFVWFIVSIYVVGIIIYSILQAWYFASVYNYFARNTAFAGGQFDMKLTVCGLVWLVISNMFIIILSLTILQPIAMARASQYFVDRMSLNGLIDVDKIVQNAAELGTTGEGLAEAFDIDGF
ncbi:MAG: YjgN family protein [Hyphomicrobiaceae bacterium]